MVRKKWFGLLLVFGLLLGVITQWPDSKLHLVVCDVGQGDAILLTQGFSQVLVDGGPNNKILNCLSEHMPFWDRNIELVVATHPDKDHIAGLIFVTDRYKTDQFVSINEANNTTVFENLRAMIQQSQIPVHVAQKGEQIEVGKIKLKVLSPDKSEKNFLVWQERQESQNNKQILGASANASDTSTNDQSLVLRVSFGEFDVLLTGDIGISIEKKIIGEDNLSGVEVLKVSHHGSRYGTSQEFLEVLSPQLATISVGKNQWGHPADEVLVRLESAGVKILRTDLFGNVEIISDGQSWYLKKSGRSFLSE